MEVGKWCDIHESLVCSFKCHLQELYLMLFASFGETAEVGYVWDNRKHHLFTSLSFGKCHQHSRRPNIESQRSFIGI